MKENTPGDWLKLYRKSLDSAVFANEAAWRLWCYLLLGANWEERQLTDGTVLKPGQLVRGIRRIAHDLGWSKGKAERWTGTLVQLGNIQTTRRSGTLAQVVTICNWETYQGDGDTEQDTNGDTGEDTKRDANGDIKKKRRSKEEKKKTMCFVRPTVEEVRAYCQERGNGIDPEEFVDAHIRNGWVVGKNKAPMKDWKATIRTWERQRKQQEGPHGSDSRRAERHPGRVY